jgi:hypothetical protein
MSHTLLLKDGQYPEEAIKTFGLKNLLYIHQYVKEQVFKSRQINISQELLVKVKELVENTDFSCRRKVEDDFREFEIESYRQMSYDDHTVFNSLKQM